MKEVVTELKDFNRILKGYWKQFKNDFVAVYKKEPRNVRFTYVLEQHNGYFTFEIGNETFPTYFRGSTDGVVSYVDPYTEKGYAILYGKVESDNVTNWYQEQ